MSYASCESRHLLAGIFFQESTGEVFIGGDSADDIGIVSQSGSTVTVTQRGYPTQTFNAADVTKVSFIGQGGDDYFENRTSIPSAAVGQGGNDILIGGSGNDRLNGNAGNDFVRGRAGDDVLVAGNGDDRVDGNEGNDRLLGISGTNLLLGGTGADQIYGGSNRDVVFGGSGDNIIAGGDGDDSLTGGVNADLILAGAGNDSANGGAGEDRVVGGNGNDTLLGGSGDDFVAGQNGDDSLNGGQGSDRIVGGSGTDRVALPGDPGFYEIANAGIGFIRLTGQRGVVAGQTETLLSVENLAFDDRVRTAQEVAEVPDPIPSSAREVVTIQPIIASNANGSNTAEFFGSADQAADIKAQIDRIYAGTGIDIQFLPAKRINNTYINIGNVSASATRPSNDLIEMVRIGDAGNGPGSSDARVIDMYFVEKVPGFGASSENQTNGLAIESRSGIAVHIGDNLVSFAAGRTVIARLVAHEIGHNLGLEHVGGTNLMTPSGRSTAITSSQRTTMLASPISRPV